MYYHLMNPEELLAHKEFFTDLYQSFEGLLYTRINNPQDYENMMSIVSVSENLATISILKLQFQVIIIIRMFCIK